MTQTHKVLAVTIVIIGINSATVGRHADCQRIPHKKKY